MSREFKLDSFLEKCRVVHNDFYNYDLVEYTGCRVKIKIKCPIHGIFKQRVDHHLSGSGCKHCRSDKMSALLSLSQDDFINRAMKVHGNIYNYSVAKYLSSKDKVKIICPTHGLFEQRATNHLNGRGCPQCGIETVADIRRGNLNDFIISANNVHGQRYSYEKSIYELTHKPLTIICFKHGEFNQAPSNHLNGQGCPKCAKYGYNDDLPCSLYVLKSINSKLLKIGISNNFEQRIDQLQRYTPFNVEVVKVFNISGNAGRSIERYLHSLGVNAGLSGFTGATEWFHHSDELLKSVDSICNDRPH